MQTTFKGLTRTDIHTYIVSDYQYEYEVTIKFVDGNFATAHYPFKKIYDRSQWRVLREIEKIITELEKKYEVEQKAKYPEPGETMKMILTGNRKENESTDNG